MLSSYVQKRAAHYNISEMSIVFGILAVVVVFPLLALGACLYYVLGASNVLAVITPLVLWCGFVGWLWVSLVIAGRRSPHERVSTGELTTMQVICVALVGLHALFASAHDRHTWEVIGSVFEWAVIGFHVIYFTLAWAMLARVPLRTYVMFVLLLGLMLLRVR